MSDPNERDASQVRETALGYRAQAEDTSRWADELLFDRLRSLDAPGKAMEVAAACRMVDQLLRASERMAHPDADSAELDFRVAVRKYGADLMERFTGRRV